MKKPSDTIERPHFERSLLDRPWARIAFTIGVTLIGAVAVTWARNPASDRLGSASFDVPTSVVASGGGRSASASFIVDGTAGQSTSVPFRSIGDTVQLTSGYWSYTETGTYWLFWDRFESGTTNGWTKEQP